MFNKVLVPLDGSLLAEAALPYVVALACTAGLEQVELLRVVQTALELDSADSYLEGQARGLAEELAPFAHGVQWASVQAEGDIATAILRFAEDNSMDLVVLSDHGRSGIDRWALGSTAEKVLRGADIPVFLVRATEGRRSPVAPRRILAPLDGSERAEQALDYVVQLSGRSASVEVTLLHVTPAAYTGASSGMPHGRDPDMYTQEGMQPYLASVVGRLAEAGINAQPRLRVGDPREQIIRAAGEASVDLIVMTSHGQTGPVEGAFGSVADYVLRASPFPVLLVPVVVSGGTLPHKQGPLGYACHQCGRRVYQEAVTSGDRCSLCYAHLKSCPNCAFFDDERGCFFGSPDAAGADPGNRCQRFVFRKARLPLR